MGRNIVSSGTGYVLLNDGDQLDPFHIFRGKNHFLFLQPEIYFVPIGVYGISLTLPALRVKTIIVCRLWNYIQPFILSHPTSLSAL